MTRICSVNWKSTGSKGLLTAMALSGSAAFGQSFINNYLGEAISINASAQVGYTGGNSSYIGGESQDIFPSIMSGGIALVDGFGQASPNSGLPKDTVSAFTSFGYTVGSPTTTDSMSIHIDGHASAQAAYVLDSNSVLQESAAYVKASWELKIPAAPGSGATTINLPTLPTTGTGTWTSQLFKYHASNTEPGAFLGAVSGPVVIDPGYNYQYLVGFDLVVPFGTDPDFNTTLTADVSFVPVPEPAETAGAGALVLVGTAFALRARSDRRRA